MQGQVETIHQLSARERQLIAPELHAIAEGRQAEERLIRMVALLPGADAEGVEFDFHTLSLVRRAAPPAEAEAEGEQ